MTQETLSLKKKFNIEIKKVISNNKELDSEQPYILNEGFLI